MAARGDGAALVQAASKREHLEGRVASLVERVVALEAENEKLVLAAAAQRSGHHRHRDVLGPTAASRIAVAEAIGAAGTDGIEGTAGMDGTAGADGAGDTGGIDAPQSAAGLLEKKPPHAADGAPPPRGEVPTGPAREP